jgi:hypothetical protein
VLPPPSDGAGLSYRISGCHSSRLADDLELTGHQALPSDAFQNGYLIGRDRYGRELLHAEKTKEFAGCGPDRREAERKAEKHDKKDRSESNPVTGRGQNSPQIR